ncbi:chitobiase/beta-hexosaminidase C-terminal domain-containing protein [Silvibacterium acidisoli]|uniref:chitobiase/beta-hexosaminidase C-terminal domain-containing protein n=1 Tax=Acidobacteriaceae bacterium ZG23-2 TaxID=2883246 RepID=UPI00406D3F0F
MSAQQMQQDMLAAGQASLQAMQAMEQANQQMLLQMQSQSQPAGSYIANPASWDTWRVSSGGHIDLSVRPGPVKPGTQVRIKWRGNEYAAVYYTLDGWSPTPASTRYTGPITITGPVHLQAVGVGWNSSRSAIIDASYDTPSAVRSAGVTDIDTDGLLKAGTRLKLKTAGEARSDSAKTGDKLSLQLDEDILEGNTVVIPKGTLVEAVLTKVVSSKGPHHPASLVLSVRSLQDAKMLVKLTGYETMEGMPAVGSGVAVIHPGITLYAKVAQDVKLQP